MWPRARAGARTGTWPGTGLGIRPVTGLESWPEVCRELRSREELASAGGAGIVEAASLTS